MKSEMYKRLEAHMIDCMKDGAHDCQHIYRVLYQALIIAADYIVDKDILIAACLLHDIGREAQYDNPACDHAIVGAKMAYAYLLELNFPEEKASRVRECICTHRFRSDNPPATIEGKILFDADKLDVAGAIGIARTLAYKGIVSEPLYSVDDEGKILLGIKDKAPSFFREYNYKLKNIYDKFFTESAKLMAEKRREATVAFYEAMFDEVIATQEIGLSLLKNDLS